MSLKWETYKQWRIRSIIQYAKISIKTKWTGWRTSITPNTKYSKQPIYSIFKSKSI